MPNPYISKGDKCKITFGGREFIVDGWAMAIVDAEKQKDANINVSTNIYGRERKVVVDKVITSQFANQKEPTFLFQERKETMPIFEVCVVEMPSKNDQDDGILEKLVLGPVAVVARDKESAGSVCVMDHADTLKDIDKARMKIYCRPFC